MNRFLSSKPLWQNNGIAILRVMIGAALIYHGCEMFDGPAMAEYQKWDQFRNLSFGKLLVYFGKGLELVSGVLLLLGLLTRLACMLIIITLSYISFFIGHGKIWYDDQYPFLFVLFGLLFIFTGPGSYSLDGLVFRNKSL